MLRLMSPLARRQTPLAHALRSLHAPAAKAPVPSGLSLASERLRRAVFYVPLSDARKIQKSYASAADCIMYDLEDGVSLNRKDQARSNLSQALANNPRAAAGQCELGVRINAMGSGLEHEDLDAALASEHLSVIMVPKVERAADVARVAERIGGRGVRIIAGIETALGVLNVREIAEAPLVDALLFAAEDYCADTGIVRTSGRQELYYARAAVSTAAHALRLQAIDMVTMDFRSPETLREESREGAEMGFTGKQVIHPAQVDVVQELFAPAPAMVERAARIVHGYEVNYAEGRGAFDLDGKAVDMPVVKWAFRVLRRAEMAGISVPVIGD